MLVEIPRVFCRSGNGRETTETRRRRWVLSVSEKEDKRWKRREFREWKDSVSAVTVPVGRREGRGEGYIPLGHAENVSRGMVNGAHGKFADVLVQTGTSSFAGTIRRLYNSIPPVHGKRILFDAFRISGGIAETVGQPSDGNSAPRETGWLKTCVIDATRVMFVETVGWDKQDGIILGFALGGAQPRHAR